MYTQIKTKENYDKLLSSGMFFEFHPELTGNYEKDMINITNSDFDGNDNKQYSEHEIDEMVEDYTKEMNTTTIKLNKIIEDIQQAQVDAGGRFLRQQEIKEMTIEYLLKLLIPNDVEFLIKHRRTN